MKEFGYKKKPVFELSYSDRILDFPDAVELSSKMRQIERMAGRNHIIHRIGQLAVVAHN